MARPPSPVGDDPDWQEIGLERLAVAGHNLHPCGRTRLGWDTRDPAPVADTVCFLLSDGARRISGEIVHVDGGFHAVGTEAVPA